MTPQQEFRTRFLPAGGFRRENDARTRVPDGIPYETGLRASILHRRCVFLRRTCGNLSSGEKWRTRGTFVRTCCGNLSFGENMAPERGSPTGFRTKRASGRQFCTGGAFFYGIPYETGLRASILHRRCVFLRCGCEVGPFGVGGVTFCLLDHLVIAAKGGKRDELAPAFGGGYCLAWSILNNALDNASKYFLPALPFPFARIRPRMGCRQALYLAKYVLTHDALQSAGSARGRWRREGGSCRKTRCWAQSVAARG